MPELPKLFFPLVGVLIALTILTVYVWANVLKSRKRSRIKREAELAYVRHQAELRQNFASLSFEMLTECDAKTLFEGVAMNIQLRLEKQADMSAAFAALTREERLIYALNYVLEDGREKLSNFFRLNGTPLTPAALEAVRDIYGSEAYTFFKLEYDAFDVENEDASVIESELEANDAGFKAALDALGDALYTLPADFVRGSGIFNGIGGNAQ